MKQLLLSACLGLLSVTAWAQPVAIELKNPSFEGPPGPSLLPHGWKTCGFPDETPPDTNPNEVFQVSMPAYYGNTYLGMVVRDNGTWEGVGQALAEPFQKNQCYGFTFFAACSRNYQSFSRMTGQEVNYNKPVKLRIWVGYDYCESLQLLAETPAIEHHDWNPYTLFFKPNAPYTHLFLEAYSLHPDKPYCGNILLDNLSDLSPVNCPDPYLAVEQPIGYGGRLPPKPDTVQFFMPQDFDQLKGLIATYSRKINFGSDNRLERKLYFVEQKKGGFMIFQNQPLHYLVAIVNQWRKMKLTIAVSDENEETLATKISSIRELLRFMDAPPSRIKVIPFSKADHRKHWVGKREGVLLAVEQK